MLIQKIMIVDDDPDLVDLLTERTESFGFECFGFSSTHKALLNIKSISPDLIIMNTDFAQISGTEFIQSLKNNLEEGDTIPPVIVLDNNDDHQINDYAFDLGTMTVKTPSYSPSAIKSMLNDYMPSEESL